MLHKRRKDCETPSKPNLKTSLKRGAINWETPYPECEGETSLKKHVEYMQNKWEKRQPDMGKIKRRMALTFPGRRRLMNKSFNWWTLSQNMARNSRQHGRRACV